MRLIFSVFVFIYTSLISCSNSYQQSQNLEIPINTIERAENIYYRLGYTVSFNPELNIPNWVAWELNSLKLVEKESRAGHFYPDPDIPRGIAVETGDYSNSGYDRGHMCPAADNKWDKQAMRESFYMTNICPQHHNLNRGDWKELEDDCRRWVEESGTIYIACGPILYKNNISYIGEERKIRVPKKRSHKETRPKPISNTFSHSVQKTSDLLKTDNFMIEEDNKAGGKSLYPSERTRDDFGVNAETPFDREEENEDFMSLNLPEEPKEPVVEDLNKIMQETGCQVLADVVVGDIQIDWLAIAKDKIYFIQKDSEDGEWLADEERFNNEDPLWYSESSHRVSPVTLLMQKQEKILALLNKAGIQMTGQCILVKDKGTIINAEDMMATWAELKVIVCRTNLGQPDELPIFGAAFSMENEAASQETINELKQVLGIK